MLKHRIWHYRWQHFCTLSTSKWRWSGASHAASKAAPLSNLLLPYLQGKTWKVQLLFPKPDIKICITPTNLPYLPWHREILWLCLVVKHKTLPFSPHPRGILPTTGMKKCNHGQVKRIQRDRSCGSLLPMFIRVVTWHCSFLSLHHCPCFTDPKHN